MYNASMQKRTFCLDGAINLIYREVIPRELTFVTTELLTQTITPFIMSNGDLDTVALLQAFKSITKQKPLKRDCSRLRAIWITRMPLRDILFSLIVSHTNPGKRRFSI